MAWPRRFHAPGWTFTFADGYACAVISVAPSPTGKLFATGSGDMRARIWRSVLFSAYCALLYLTTLSVSTLVSPTVIRPLWVLERCDWLFRLKMLIWLPFFAPEFQIASHVGADLYHEPQLSP